MISGGLRLSGAAAAAILGFASPASYAQTAQPPCVLDKCLGLKPAPGQGDPGQPAAPDAGQPAAPDAAQPAAADAGQQPAAARRNNLAPGKFDFYVLSLSWSPGFCASGGAQKAKEQCAPGSGLGFVVHGLWPQFDHGFPSDCGPAGRVPSRQALEATRGVYPDVGLARYEWTKHGTCSGKSPTDYFADVKAARDGVTIPQPFVDARADQTWAPLDVARAFVAANAGLRTDEMSVTCRQGMLEEVRICLSKDLRSPVACPEVARAACRTRQLTVPAPL